MRIGSAKSGDCCIAITALLMFLSGLSIANAEQDPATPTDAPLPLEQLLTNQAAQLVFGDPPSVSQATFEMAVQYSHIAKGFWIEKKCEFLAKADIGADLALLYEAKVGMATKIMRGVLIHEDGYANSSADEKTQELQMYALNEMSVKTFYACDKNAWNLSAHASKVLEQWVQAGIAAKQDGANSE